MRTEVLWITNYSINMEFRFSHKMNAKRGEKSNLKQMENIKNMPHIFGGYK